MQAQVSLEQNNVVIRFPKDLMSQEALSDLVDFIEHSSDKHIASLQEQALLARERAIHLKAEDMQYFLQTLENPPCANEALKDAACWHKKLINNA